MSVEVRIRYLLSEQGRRESLLNGGDGHRIQEVTGDVDESDLACFNVDDDGNAGLDLLGSFHVFSQPALEFSDRARWQDSSHTQHEYEIHWDVVPSWDDLMDIARQLKKDADNTAGFAAEREKAKEQAGDAFVKDQRARATSVAKDHVLIGEHRFDRYHPVGMAAHRRWQHDQDELKKTNRATLAEWVGQHGTENQRQRLAAGLLPWKEAFDAAEDYLFRPAEGFRLYERFEITDVCLCLSRAEGETCDVKFQSVDATELTADEWEEFSRIKSHLPGAQFQLREHRAQCASVTEAQVRRGVIVKFTMGQLAFKREFVLTQIEVSF
jgi:hypothetical protein